MGRHAQQIGARSEQEWKALSPFTAVTWRPGDSTNTFKGKLLRRAGAAVAVVVSYQDVGARIAISGYRARVHINGLVSWGRDGDREFCHDGRLAPTAGGVDAGLDADRNPSLVDVLLRIDGACHRAQTTGARFLGTPRLPRIWLGFAPSEPPEFEDTLALRKQAARIACVSLQKLTTNPPALVERLLRDCWESQLQLPGAPGNNSSLVLIDAEYCTQADRALQVFEDFNRLVGACTWNPARVVDVLRVANPVGEILERHGIDASASFDQPLPAAVIEVMEHEMRQALGDLALRFDPEDLLDGLTEPGLPLYACSEAMPRLRSKLASYCKKSRSASVPRTKA